MQLDVVRIGYVKQGGQGWRKQHLTWDMATQHGWLKVEWSGNVFKIGASQKLIKKAKFTRSKLPSVASYVSTMCCAEL